MFCYISSVTSRTTTLAAFKDYCFSKQRRKSVWQYYSSRLLRFVNGVLIFSTNFIVCPTLSSVEWLGGASWVARLSVWLGLGQVSVSYLNRNFVVVLVNSFCGAVYRIAF